MSPVFTNGGTAVHTLVPGDWIRLRPNGNVEFFMTASQLAVAAGAPPATGISVPGAHALLQTAAGDLYYVPRWNHFALRIGSCVLHSNVGRIYGSEGASGAGPPPERIKECCRVRCREAFPGGRREGQVFGGVGGRDGRARQRGRQQSALGRALAQVGDEAAAVAEREARGDRAPRVGARAVDGHLPALLRAQDGHALLVEARAHRVGEGDLGQVRAVQQLREQVLLDGQRVPARHAP